VLEVGCGRGNLARGAARLGYQVDAIDPEAPVGAIFHAVSLEEFSDPGPFDAVLANLALHHIPDLSDALAKIRRLLRPGGRVNRQRARLGPARRAHGSLVPRAARGDRR
jgi:2-polyprenyl-3-methyl-5-hydroxy-6-metoxy-1,4-benzoquinol methylase